MAAQLLKLCRHFIKLKTELATVSKDLNIYLDLFKHQEKLSFRKQGGQVYIYDVIRRKYLVQTPEEIVRQLVVLYFIHENYAPPHSIAVEKAFEYNKELLKRFDILIFDGNYRPFLLVECKAPDVAVEFETFFQAGIYNQTFKVPFVLVTNGVDAYCYAIDHTLNTFNFLKELPPYPSQSSG